MPQQEQTSQPQRKGPPPGWRYSAQAKPRSQLRGWLAAVWKGTKENAALASLVGVLLTLLVTTVLTQREGVRQQNQAQEDLINQRDLESDRAKAAAAEAEQQAQQESLQTYLGDMGELILRDTSPLPEASPDDEVSQLARAKTLTVLGGLDPQSKGIVLQFLREAQLIQREGERAPIITLYRADLSDVKLESALLSGTDLSGANLSNADLSGANLSNADLSRAGLSNADLRLVDLRDASLSGADMSGADMRSSYLREADMSGAYLLGADLNETDLNGTDLSNAQGVNKGPLEQQAASVEGATMPDGSEHP